MGKVFFACLLNTFIMYMFNEGRPMNKNNLFIQRRFQVQEERSTGNVNFIGSLYIAYYFFVDDELFVSKYALCIKLTKTRKEIKQLLKK